LVISPMLWLSVANKDVYIIYCLLFTYSALSVTYLPPRGAKVHALNRKSVKNKEFPVPLYWVSLVWQLTQDDGFIRNLLACSDWIFNKHSVKGNYDRGAMSMGERDPFRYHSQAIGCIVLLSRGGAGIHDDVRMSG